MHTLAGTGPAALLEREDELERAHTIMRAVGQRAGCVLVIEGAAGIHIGRRSLTSPPEHFLKAMLGADQGDQALAQNSTRG